MMTVTAMHETQPLVYIVVLNWNGWPDTIECLKSLEEQSYERCEVVVIDNGSMDDSVQRLAEMSAGIHLLETGQNLGFSAGNNAGVRFALAHHADFVWLLNNDTKVYSQTLAELVHVAMADRSLGAVGSVLMNMQAPESIQAWGGGTVHFWCGCSKNARGPAKLDYLTAASILIPRDVFERVGLLDERYFLYWEDVDLSFRIRASGYTLAVAEKSVVLHKASASSSNHSFRLDSYVSYSLTRFMLDHSPTPTLSILFGLLGKIFKRLISLRFLDALAICKGFWQALMSSEKRKEAF